MSLDANGNWFPNLPDGPAANQVCEVNVCVRSGAPTDDQGLDGDLSYNRSNGNVYEKVDGTWVLLPGGGGGGGSNNQSGNGSPVGTHMPDYVGQLYLDKTTPRDLWISTGVTNTSWLLLLQDIT